MKSEKQSQQEKRKLKFQRSYALEQHYPENTLRKCPVQTVQENDYSTAEYWKIIRFPGVLDHTESAVEN